MREKEGILGMTLDVAEQVSKVFQSIVLITLYVKQ